MFNGPSGVSSSAVTFSLGLHYGPAPGSADMAVQLYWPYAYEIMQCNGKK